MQKKESVRMLTQAAMMVALSVIIGIFCKSFLNFGAGLFRITFENLPIILSGIIMGPVVGGAVGACSDIVSYFFSGQAYPLNFIVTAGAALTGVLSGIVSRYFVKNRGTAQIIASGAVAHIVGSMIVKSIGLFQFYQYMVLLRIPMYMVIAPLEIFIICLLLKRKSFARVVGYCGKNYKAKGEEAVKYIHSVNWTFCKPGLDRIGELCKRLGNPQNKLKFIHVAGTNGKGSFCSMLSSILAENGYRVGLFTSPYIKCFNERMQINGKMIEDKELARITEKIRPIADSMVDKPTEFELVTAIAFEYFKSHKCDYVVLECGLGGRLDSTNIISTPIATVITGIALDHTSILGDTVGKIAKEKAGIIKAGVPCIWCGESEEAHEVIKSVAQNQNAPFCKVNRESLSVKKVSLDGAVFDYMGYTNLKLGLLGQYQVINATNVLTCVDVLRKSNVSVSEKSVYRGLEKAKWPARFERLSYSPLVIYDGGHNPQGVDSCVESIEKYFGEEKVLVLTGVMQDKDYGYIAEKISTVAQEVFCITPNNPRALDSIEYAREFALRGVFARGYNDVTEAVNAAVEKAKNEKKPLVCMGSLYMYPEIVGALEKAL